MDNVIGTCSLCGGPVVLPSMMVHPVAHCQKCGARQKQPHGPVVPMEKPAEQGLDRDVIDPNRRTRWKLGA
jgi:hypothetical protein